MGIHGGERVQVVAAPIVSAVQSTGQHDNACDFVSARSHPGLRGQPHVRQRVWDQWDSWGVTQVVGR